MKKAFRLILLVLLMISLAVPAYAVETANLDHGIVTPQFTAILSISSGLDIDSNGKATCTGSVTPSNNAHKANITVSLQKSTTSGWSTVKSWSASGTGYIGAYVEEHYYVARGTYRVCTTASIYNSSGALQESASFYSEQKTY